MTRPPACRSCQHEELRLVLDLGSLPLVDRLLEKSSLQELEPTYPLRLMYCDQCHLLQTEFSPAPELLFTEDFPYYSSVSHAFVEHAKQHAENLITTRSLDRSTLVLEIASNDGYLLQHFARRNIPVLGIDPAAGPARTAQQKGIATRIEFFDMALATELKNQSIYPHVILANNVFAHVPDPGLMLEAMKLLLHDHGIIVIEVPYVKELIDQLAFDTIYHEHHSYFSVSSLNHLCSTHDLYIHDVEAINVHGGSIRITIGKNNAPKSNLLQWLQMEDDAGLNAFAYYQQFSTKVRGFCERLHNYLAELKASNASIAAYGAAAKGAVLLNAAQIDRTLIDFAVDLNPVKQGKFMPGVRIPIYAPQRLLERKPDFTLLLTWNFAKEILRQQQEYVAAGGRFVDPRKFASQL